MSLFLVVGPEAGLERGQLRAEARSGTLKRAPQYWLLSAPRPEPR